MIDHNGKNIDVAYPSSPVEILGLNEKAKQEMNLLVVDNEDEAKKNNTFKKSGC